MDWMRFAPALLFASALALPACSGNPEATPYDSLHACSAKDGPNDAYCGSLVVWEDRVARAGRKIGLRIVLLPALARRHASDPLFVLAGGPGQGAAELATTLADALRPIQLRRDIVFVDLRGTGGSNPLDCEGAQGAMLAGSADAAAAALAVRMRSCLQGYADRADVTKYTTAIAMDDLDDVRARLGYSKIDLYGVSYGTRAAIVYASRHGEHLRSVVLDGAMPPSKAFPLDMARDAQRAMDLLFRDCARQAACARRFPDLPARLARLLDGLERHPRHVR